MITKKTKSKDKEHKRNKQLMGKGRKASYDNKKSLKRNPKRNNKGAVIGVNSNHSLLPPTCVLESCLFAPSC